MNDYVICNMQCKNCKKTYKIYDEAFAKELSSKDFYCNDVCKKIGISNEKWLTTKYDGTPKPLKGNSQKVAYSFFRKKYGVKSKYKVCRG